MHLLSFRCLLILALLVATAGCKTVEKQEQSNAFTKNTVDYGRMLRWRNYEQATEYLRSREDKPVSFDIRPLKQLRVTGYNIVKSQMSPEGNRATIVAEIEYYWDGQNVVREIEDTQDWWYDEDAKHWYIDGTLPDFK